MGVQEKDPLAQLSLPPGFRFYPTDEELMVQYLCRKVAGQSFSLQIIGEVDLYKFDPWLLPSKAFFGEKEWYFFSPRDRKYPNGSRPNRVAGSGYWKATGTDKIITTEGRKVGIKKALVFYVGKAPKGIKTNWIMHEYRLIDSSCKKGSSKLDEWVLCRLYKKNSSAQKSISSVSSQEYNTNASSFSSSSHLDDVINSLPEIDDQLFTLPRTNELSTSHRDEKVNLHNLGSGSFDWASLAGLNSVAELVPGGHKSRGMVSYGQNDLYVPQFQHQDQVYDMDKKIRNSVEEEGKQRGLRGQTMDNSGLLAQNFTNPIDPFVFKYPTQSSGFEFRQ